MLKSKFEHTLFVVDQICNGKFLLTLPPKSIVFQEQKFTVKLKNSTIIHTKKPLFKRTLSLKNSKTASGFRSIKEFKQDLIVDFEKIIGEEISKKTSPSERPVC